MLVKVLISVTGLVAVQGSSAPAPKRGEYSLVELEEIRERRDVVMGMEKQYRDQMNKKVMQSPVEVEESLLRRRMISSGREITYHIEKRMGNSKCSVQTREAMDRGELWSVRVRYDDQCECDRAQMNMMQSEWGTDEEANRNEVALFESNNDWLYRKRCEEEDESNQRKGTEVEETLDLMDILKSQTIDQREAVERQHEATLPNLNVYHLSILAAEEQRGRHTEMARESMKRQEMMRIVMEGHTRAKDELIQKEQSNGRKDIGTMRLAGLRSMRGEERAAKSEIKQRMEASKRGEIEGMEVNERDLRQREFHESAPAPVTPPVPEPKPRSDPLPEQGDEGKWILITIWVAVSIVVCGVMMFAVSKYCQIRKKSLRAFFQETKRMEELQAVSERFSAELDDDQKGDAVLKLSLSVEDFPSESNLQLAIEKREVVDPDIYGI